VRQQIVKARLGFDLNPQAFRAACAGQQAEHVHRIRAARAALPALGFDDAVHAHVSALCIAAAVDGLRADLVMLRAARALAALEQAAAVTTGHVDQVAEAVLHHRRHGRETPPQADAPTQPSPQGSGADAAPPDSANAATGDSEWGYLPPEPAGTTQVKGVIPLNAKKR
jgi:magnesium chelatase subunit I